MFRVEPSCGFILGVGHDGEGGDLRPPDAHRRICQQCRAQMAALKGLSHRQPPQQGRRHERVARPVSSRLEADSV